MKREKLFGYSIESIVCCRLSVVDCLLSENNERIALSPSAHVGITLIYYISVGLLDHDFPCGAVAHADDVHAALQSILPATAEVKYF